MTHLAPEDLQRRQYSARARRRAALAAHHYAQHAPVIASKRIRERRKHGQALRRQERDHVASTTSVFRQRRVSDAGSATRGAVLGGSIVSWQFHRRLSTSESDRFARIRRQRCCVGHTEECSWRNTGARVRLHRELLMPFSSAASPRNTARLGRASWLTKSSGCLLVSLYR